MVGLVNLKFGCCCSAIYIMCAGTKAKNIINTNSYPENSKRTPKNFDLTAANNHI